MVNNGTAFLATSSFSLIPGIPVYSSSNLSEWVLESHAIDESMAERLFLKYTSDNNGIFAPTIRMIKGTVMIASTVVRVDVEKALGDGADPKELEKMRRANGNFVITARSARGPWRGPFWIEGARGNDPDLFLDDDGTVWWTANRIPAEQDWPEQTQIWTCELDIDRWQLKGNQHVLWTGAMTGAVWSEAPHLLKKEGFYYLLTAEGGTERNHSQVVARSHALTGPYEGNPRNPVLTHRNLTRKFPVQNVGHSDLLEDSTGRWWGVCLGVRLSEGLNFLGREPFVFPVVWEEGWPVFSPFDGRLPLNVLPQGAEAEDGRDASKVYRPVQVINKASDQIVAVPSCAEFSWVRVDSQDFAVMLHKADMPVRIYQDCSHYVELSIAGGLRLLLKNNETEVKKLGIAEESKVYGLRLVGSVVQVVSLEKSELTEVLADASDDDLVVIRGSDDYDSAKSWGQLMLYSSAREVHEGFAVVQEVSAAFLSSEAAQGYVGCLAGSSC
jgi:alpha-N-arabinofuranosidase